MNIIFWGFLIIILIASGWVTLLPMKHIGLTERTATSFVIGAVVLPFLLFLLRSITHFPIFGQTSFAYGVAILLVVLAIILLVTTQPWRNLSMQPLRNTLKTSLGTRILMVILSCTIIIFFYQVVQGLQKPIFGWDEYSFWLYAAKLIYLNHGSTTVMLHDAYNTYPLGFPFLVALAYQFTGGIHIVTAKWLSAILTTFMLIAMYSLLRRLGSKPLFALLAVAMTVWGSRIFLWYNFLAFGEMSYVDTYVLGVFYLSAWFYTKEQKDLLIAGLLLGLTCFLRVDGMYITLFTLVLFLLCIPHKERKKLLKGHFIVPFAALLLPPIVVWEGFKLFFHAHGWTTRISLKELAFRLQPSFLQTMWDAIWHTVSNVSIYPIMVILVCLLLFQIMYRTRAIAFLTLLSITQIVYLFVAYLTVFSRFEALHASSMDRYLLRIDPLIAVAFILLIGLTSPRNKDNAKEDDNRTYPTHR